MKKKYNSLKNMTEEEKKAYKRAQKNAIQKEFYKKHKDEIKEKYKGKYNYAAIYKARIDRAIEYINNTNFWGIYEDIPMKEVKYGDELLEILKGDSDWSSR